MRWVLHSAATVWIFAHGENMLLEKIIEQGGRQASRLAILDDQRSITFRRLVLGADIMAGHIDRIVGDDDKVGLLLPQSSAFAAAFLGTRWSDRTAVPLNYLLRPPELIAICRDAGLTTVFTIRFFQNSATALQEAGVRTVFMEDLSFSSPLIGLSRLTGFKRRLPAYRPEKIAAIIYTSGTSGEPKGVMLTDHNLDSNAAAAIEHARFDQRMTFLGVLPMFHALGIMSCFLVPLSLGCTVVYQARLNPAGIFQAIQKHKIEVLVAVPSMYALLANVKNAGHAALASVRYAVSGGEPLPRSLCECFQRQFGITLLEGFGLTETSPMVSFSVPWANKSGSVGKPLPRVQLRIVDDGGHTLGPNQDGELWIKGPSVMKGYYRRPAETAQVLTTDGWLKTGDIARIDDEGFLFITGRKKEMINMAGEKIAPGEIEEAIRRHPAVLLAAVIGVKDAQRGEVPVAFIQLAPALEEKPTAQDIRIFLRQRLAPYKTPRDVYFIEEMPRLPTGKIIKRALSIPQPSPLSEPV